MKPSVRRSAARRGPERRDAVAKTFDVLWLLVEGLGEHGDREWGVRELAEKLGFSPATVHRALAGLMRHGLAQQKEASAKYGVGVEVYRLALKVQPHLALRNAALPVMHELVAKCNEAAFLGFYDSSRLQMMFVAVIYPTHPLRYVVPLNEWIPVHAGASGLAVMAFVPPGERRAIIARWGLSPITEATITDPEALEDELARVRARGYALSRGQRTRGAVAVAAPIWGPDGRVLGELNLSLPEPRFDKSMTADLARLVIAHAQRVTESLGGQPAGAPTPTRKQAPTASARPRTP